MCLQVFGPNLQAGNEKHQEKREPGKQRTFALLLLFEGCKQGRQPGTAPFPRTSRRPPLQFISGEEEVALEEVLEYEAT